MTPNTIAYASLLENKRHNIASEKQNLQKLKNDFNLGKASNAVAAQNARTNAQNALTNLYNVQSNAQKWVAELAQTKVRDKQNYFTNLERNQLQKYATDVTKYLGEIESEIKRERNAWEKDVAQQNADANTRNAISNSRNSWTNRYKQQNDAEEREFRQQFDAIMAQMEIINNAKNRKITKKNNNWSNVNNSIKSIGGLISGIGGIFGKGKK